ncbi:MAG: GTPase Era [Candidatus Rokubacteria bacterium]|nr:GTPase Era [Candidatus Rokubacteria bacterium]
MTMRAGFVSLIGRPNAGKSTLLNRLVGQKLAIVSPRPQTTRNRITGIVNRPDAQVVFVDTPGLHAGKGKLGEFMQRTAERAVEDVDLVCLVVDAVADPGPDDVVLGPLSARGGPAFCLLNKADAVEPKARILPMIERWRDAHPFRELLPISATDGTNCDRLLELIVASMPEHPAYFPPDVNTDQPETFYIAEAVREKIFHFTHEEVPYAAAVRVGEVVERPEPNACLVARATIFVEHDSQRGILIGKGGSMLKRIGTAARQELEAFFGIQVFLGLTVQVRRNWRKDERALREFGLLLTS